MKQILFSLLIILSSCKSKHFEFDNAVHYRVEIKDDEHNNLITVENKSEVYEDFDFLLYEEYPKIIDNSFLRNLDKYYPIKHEISKSKLAELKDIYVDGFNFNMSTCAPIYRDILVFQQKDSIVGISKICFECNLQYTIDQNGEQKEFDDNDFQKLREILK